MQENHFAEIMQIILRKNAENIVFFLRKGMKRAYLLQFMMQIAECLERKLLGITDKICWFCLLYPIKLSRKAILVFDKVH